MKKENLNQGVTVVTGAGGGIGQATVQGLLREGHHVVAVVRKAHSLPAHPSLSVVEADITSESDRLKIRSFLASRYPGITGLINNAGIGMGSIRPSYYKDKIRLDEIDSKILNQFLSINAHAPIALSLELLPLFNRSWGRIINIGTSLTAMLRPGFLPYAMSKAALESASAVMATDLQKTHITVSILNPGGPVHTPMAKREEPAEIAKLISIEKMVPPLCWLASVRAQNINGMRVNALKWDIHHMPDALSPIGWPQLASDSLWGNLNTSS
jgi:NAD(P)-dependent dehydrogenase (short-subunit alcohol dehydrogenase family)